MNNHMLPQRDYKKVTGYRFVEKDPELQELMAFVGAWCKANRTGLKVVANLSGVSYSTLNKWYLGSTLRPQNATMTAVLAAIGKKRIYVDI